MKSNLTKPLTTVLESSDGVEQGGVVVVPVERPFQNWVGGKTNQTHTSIVFRNRENSESKMQHDVDI